MRKANPITLFTVLITAVVFGLWFPVLEQLDLVIQQTDNSKDIISCNTLKCVKNP